MTNNIFFLYGIVVIITIVMYHAFKAYYKRKRLLYFRSQLSAGQCISILAYGTYNEAEIVNIHEGLIFCFLPESGLYSYVEPSNIYPYDY